MDSAILRQPSFLKELRQDLPERISLAAKSLLNQYRFPTDKEVQQHLAFYPVDAARDLIRDLSVPGLDFNFSDTSLSKLAKNCLAGASSATDWFTKIGFGASRRKIIEAMNHFAVNHLLDLLLSPSLNKKLINPTCKAFRGILNRNQDLIADILVTTVTGVNHVKVDQERAISLITKITNQPIQHLMKLMQAAQDDKTQDLVLSAIKILGENSRNENITYLLSDDFLSALSLTDHDQASIYTQALSTLLGLKEVNLSFSEFKSKLLQHLIRWSGSDTRKNLYQNTLARILNSDPDNPGNQAIIERMRKIRDTFGTISETWKLLNDRARKSFGDIRELVESVF